MKYRRIFNRSFWLPILILAIIVLLNPSATSAQDEHAKAGISSAGTHIIRSDETGLHFQLHTNPYQVDFNGRIQVDALEQSIREPGSPDLPYFSTLIALPPQADVSVSIHESGLIQHPEVEVLPVPLEQLHAAPDPQGILAADPATILESAPLSSKNQAIYALDALYPEARYELSEPMYLRDLRLVELKLFPLRYNPARNSLTQAGDLSVELTFSGADFKNLHPSPGFVDNQAQALRDTVLNFDQAHNWRSLPATGPQAKSSDLPIGVDTFKILVDQDGIYEISGAELAAQGMNLPVNPATIEMMHGGLPVAFQFIDVNGGGQFDAGDKIRFYGWAFDGSRYEQMYVNDNVFWLWAGGSANPIPLADNEAGSGTVVTNFIDSVTRQDENDNFSGWAVNWQNEPTTWHWDLITAPSGQTTSKTYDIELPDPDPTATGSTVLVELTTKLNSLLPTVIDYSARTYLNTFAGFGEADWTGRENLNIINVAPGSAIKTPADSGYPNNQIKINLSSNSATAASVYLTRITVEYTRKLTAVGDQLIFSFKGGGKHDFQVSGFSSGDASSAVVWDISDRRQPAQIRMQVQNIRGGSSNYTYIIGRNHGQDARFIATNPSNFLPVKGLSRYKPVSLVPPDKSAQWLAITHSSLRNAADTLAAHRAKDFKTWVVNIEDITNQVGYGFNTPETIRSYLFHATTNWKIGPEYVTLFGDATRNPLMQECPLCNPWNKDTPTLLVTDFVFEDRWNGMIPSDYSMSLLIGNDLLSDVTIGRMPANTLVEANNMVQKVINYENQRLGEGEEWQKNFLFVADDPDGGGNFCAENILTGTNIPTLSYNQTHLCLPAPTLEDTDAIRVEMGKHVNDIGTSILNYRGHGSTNQWASHAVGGSILTADDIDFWQNVGRSVVILSADCLDGYFINTHTSALGETFHRLSGRGSVAHWSSSGLGFSSEHTILHSGFYIGMFSFGLKEIGNAVNYAKIEYYLSGRAESELYSFILLGDPALKVIPKSHFGFEGILMPIIMALNK